MTDHKIGTREEWLAAREQLLVREKEHTRLGDELARQRRELPWVRVEKEYRFDTDDGEKALGELFDGRSQLLVYHFMFGPSYEAGCPVNSSIADAVDGVLPHLHARDVTFAIRLASAAGEAAGLQAPHGLEYSLGLVRAHRLQLRPRLLVHRGTGPRGRGADEGDRARWPGDGLPPIVEHNARSTGTDVVGYLTESPGFSTFVHDDGTVYHTYSTTWRGMEFLMGYYPILDHAPKGRDEGEAGSSGSAGTTSTRASDAGCYDNRRQSSSGDRGQSRYRTGAGRGSLQLKGATMSAVPTIHRFPVKARGRIRQCLPGRDRVGGRRRRRVASGLRRQGDARGYRPARKAAPGRASDALSSRPLRWARRDRRRRRGPDLRTAGVIDTITADDALKDQIVGPLFGEEWPPNRVFPNTAIADGESVSFDDVTFTVVDLGPSESPHDSPWIVGDDAKTVFLGDQIYDHKHCYLADGFYAQWLANIETLRTRFPERRRVLHRSRWTRSGPRCGTGSAATSRLSSRLSVEADWSEPERAKAAVVGRMKEYEPSDELQFLMELSIEPVAQQLGLMRTAAAG